MFTNAYRKSTAYILHNLKAYLGFAFRILYMFHNDQKNPTAVDAGSVHVTGNSGDINNRRSK